MPKTLSVAFMVMSIACSSAPQPLPSPPAELPGGYRLSEPNLSVTPPPLAAQLGVKRNFAALYRGPSDLKVTFYEMPGESAAFELAQKWRPSPGMLFFHEGSYFVTVESPGLPYAKLSPVINALRKTVVPSP